MNKQDLLHNFGFFQGISRANCEALAGICHLRNFARKERLFLEGAPGSAMYACLAGQVQAIKTNEDGREVVIKTFGAGELFGEVILFENDRYPVTAVALTDVKTFEIRRDEFRALLADEDFRNDFIGLLMKKQRYLAEKIKYLTTHDVESRLRFFLEEQYGRTSEIRPFISKKDLAAAIGATPETFSRLLLRLKHSGALVWVDKVMTIDPSFWEEEF